MITLLNWLGRERDPYGASSDHHVKKISVLLVVLMAAATLSYLAITG